jgi:antitoxin VapB
MLSIRNAEVEELARRLSRERGNSMTEVILDALKTQDGKNADHSRRLRMKLGEIASTCASLPDLDTRSAEEILGYDESGSFDNGHR